MFKDKLNLLIEEEVKMVEEKMDSFKTKEEAIKNFHLSTWSNFLKHLDTSEDIVIILDNLMLMMTNVRYEVLATDLTKKILVCHDEYQNQQ